MARPKKIGLDYFPLDVDFFSDKKIKRLKACVGVKGIVVYLFLLCEIYRAGYWISCDEDQLLDIADTFGISCNLTKEILNCLISRGLFDKQLADSENILTSASIQRRYLAAKKSARSAVTIEDRYWLLKSKKTDASSEVYPDDNYCGENDSFYGENNDKSRKNNIKKSKVKESKVNILSICENAPAFEDVVRYVEEEGLGVSASKFYEYYTHRNWTTKNGEPIKDWKGTLRYWAQKERQRPGRNKKEIPESPMADAYRSLIYNMDE